MYVFSTKIVSNNLISYFNCTPSFLPTLCIFHSSPLWLYLSPWMPSFLHKHFKMLWYPFPSFHIGPSLFTSSPSFQSLCLSWIYLFSCFFQCFCYYFQWMSTFWSQIGCKTTNKIVSVTSYSASSANKWQDFNKKLLRVEGRWGQELFSMM